MTIQFGAKIGEASSTPLHTLGTRYHTDNGKEFIYLLADEAITGAGYSVVIDQDFGSTMADTASSVNAYGKAVAVPTIAVTNAYYYWGQVYGQAHVGVRVAASAAAGSKLNTTGTGGVLDDDATAGAENIDGIFVSVADGGSGSAIAAFLSYPIVGATLA
jgi:hypothetical protein